MKFYKILNAMEYHNGLRFREGRVDDPRPFREKGSCAPGGIYFAPVTSIFALLGLGPWLREVTIPDDAQTVRESGNGFEIYRASSIVLGPRERWDDPEVLQRLIAEGADIHIDDDYALRCAAEDGYTKAVQVLLDAGADVHSVGDFALRWAAEGGHTETVHLLLETGADVHARKDEALRLAASNGHTKVVQMLLDAGADVYAWNDYALRWALESGHLETVQVLREAGAFLST